MRPLLIVGVCLCIGATAYLFFGLPDFAANGASSLGRYDQLPPLKPGDRITVIAPHLDDETIGLGGFIAQARAQQISVSLVFMTNGDDNPLGADLEFKTGYPTPDQLIQSGIDRQKEATLALQQLGVDKNNLYFLGLPDRGLKTMLDSRYANTAYRSPGTLKSSSPYPNSYVTSLSYTGNATRAALQKVINQTQPTLVFTTLPDDRHTDHAATATFVQQVLPGVTVHPRLYYFLVHYPRFPRPKAIDSSKPLIPPVPLANRPWKVIFLDAADINRQQQAISEYKTQLRIPFMARLMKGFVRKNELVLPGF